MEIARLFEIRGRNAYVPLLYDELEQLGLASATDARFDFRGLWQSRRRVACLQFGWGPDDHYLWRRRDGRPRGMLSLLRLGLFGARLLAARALGYRIVWTIHEVYTPHSRVSRRLDRLAGRLLARGSHVLVAHDPAVAGQARRELGAHAMKIQVIPHGSYVGVYPAGQDRSAVREELGIAPDAFVFLCFGTVRTDKDIVLLLEAFQTLPRRNAVLIVAGQVRHGEVGARIAEAAAADSRIRWRPGFVRNERVAELFGAADAAVLARSETWTSASLILALSLGVPVVAARIGSHEELLGEERAGWLFEPGDVESLRDALERAVGGAALARVKGEAAVAQAARLPPWSEVAERMAGVMWTAAGESVEGHGARSPAGRASHHGDGLS